jgi:hypothetical protein
VPVPVVLRRQSPVSSAAGRQLGHVVGFLVEEREQISHLVLEHVHLWGRRQVAIPGNAIERLENDEVVLRLPR